MTREILFRGFHECEDGAKTIYIEGKAVNGRWIEGAYSPFDWDICGKRTEKAQIIAFADDENDGCWTECIPSTVGEYTGMKDKHSRQIFEEDIIRNTANTNWDLQIVKYGECRNWILDGMGNKPFKARKCSCLVSREAKSIFEVIGTVFDKPR